MADIETLDKAPTNKGTCFYCRKNITKGTPRIWYNDTLVKEVNKIKNMRVKRLICHRCTGEVLEGEVSKRKKELKKYVGFRRRFIRMMKGKRIKAIILKEKVVESLEDKPQSWHSR